MGKDNLRLSRLDRYLICQLIPILIFSVFICTIVCELVGISFEQIKFVAIEGLPLNLAIRVHILKLPTFICQAVPLALLITTIVVYSKLADHNEILALKSYGLSPYRLILPTVVLAFAISGSLFTLQELMVPDANYQAAIILEREWQVDRTQLAKYNKREIIYQQFDLNSNTRNLEFSFFADSFDGEQMQNVILLRYKNRRLHEIILSQTARWQEAEQKWLFTQVRHYILDRDSLYEEIKDVEQLSLKLTKNIFDYANHHRDLREMNLFELHRRREIVQNTNNSRKIRQLNITIQSRYALPFTCVGFAFLGSVFGATKFGRKSNSLGVAAIAIIVYYCLQTVAIALTLTEVLPVWFGVWLPNLVCLSLGFYWQERSL